MRRLLLLRHAKSSWSEPGASDHDRPLNRRGQEAAPRIGAYLARHRLIPDRVLCSTARRARETWELVATEASAAPPPTFTEPAAFVRLITSATIPAGSVNRKNASEVTTGIRERKKDELASEFINQMAAVL